MRNVDPDAKLFIGLVDKLDPTIDYAAIAGAEILPCFELGYPEFQGMLERYNIIEFNTAVKPFFFEYLFRRHPNTDRVYYLDPDLFFYQSLHVLEEEWEDAEVLVTPNLIYTSSKPGTGELASLRHGMYNLGFIGLKRGSESFRLILWWKERLREHCRVDKCWGLFVDQKWMDLAPLFFDRIKVVKHPGWNMAWWNFDERNLLESGGGYAVNSPKTSLVFFHFSGFKPENTHLTERIEGDEFRDAQNEVMTKLYEDYRSCLLEQGYDRLSKVKTGLIFRSAPNSRWNRIGRTLKSKANNLIYRLFGV